MARALKNRSRKAGLPPGTLIHIGQKKADTQKITVMDYDEKGVQEYEVQDIQQCAALKDKPTITWINVDGLHDIEKLRALGDCFGLHPLVLEDILNTDQRPKMEEYGDYLYLVFKMLYFEAESQSVLQEQISLILGETFVISFQEREGDVFEPVRERIRSGKGLIRKMGADYLVYTLLDVIVDNYFSVLEKLGENIEILAERVLKTPEPKTLSEIQIVKKRDAFHAPLDLASSRGDQRTE